MSFVAAIDTHVPISGCDVGRYFGAAVDGITKDFGVEKFARFDWIDAEVSKCLRTTFAECLDDVDNVCHLFTPIDPIGYEYVRSADRFEARQFTATALTVGGVGLGHNFGRQPAVPAITISEGPENGH